VYPPDPRPTLKYGVRSDAPQIGRERAKRCTIRATPGIRALSLSLTGIPASLSRTGARYSHYAAVYGEVVGHQVPTQLLFGVRWKVWGHASNSEVCDDLGHNYQGRALCSHSVLPYAVLSSFDRSCISYYCFIFIFYFFLCAFDKMVINDYLLLTYFIYCSISSMCVSCISLSFSGVYAVLPIGVINR